MLDKWQKAKESGFTLIELMVVVLIIAILIAIAIPTFIGLRNNGHDSQARSNLRNTITAVKAYYTNNMTYTSVDAANLTLHEQAIPFIDNNTAPGCTATITGLGDNINHGSVDIFTQVASGDVLCLAVWSKGAKKWFYFSSSGRSETLVIR